tara:strand:- start:55 stop:321 length:267 start_codon:yes stop_codon:yes gene_type:complete
LNFSLVAHNHCSISLIAESLSFSDKLLSIASSFTFSASGSHFAFDAVLITDFNNNIVSTGFSVIVLVALSNVPYFSTSISHTASTVDS